MPNLAVIAVLLSGLGLFFIGVRSLSAHLVPLVGRRTRAVFARCLQGPISTALSGVAAGLTTQSSTAVSWITLGFVRAGILPHGPALGAPTWANVGTAMLPLVVAIDTKTAAGLVIGMVGFATYFKLARSDRARNMLSAALGAAFVLFGMQLVSSAVGPIRGAVMAGGSMTEALHSPWVLIVIGAGSSLIAQSSSVAAAIAVAAVGAGLLTVPTALPLIAAANGASVLNNLMLMPGENRSGRLVFAMQALQKLAGTCLLAAVAIAPALLGPLRTISADGQIAVTFALAQFGGALIASLLMKPLERLLHRIAPPSRGEALAQPAFLLREVLRDPPAALDLAMRELARVAGRLPLLLDPVRIDNADDRTLLPTETLRSAGRSLADAIRSYLTALLDHHPTRHDAGIARLVDDATDNAGALHDTLGELVAVFPKAAGVPTANHLVEALHAILAVVADHAETPEADDADLVLGLLGHRDSLMEELRTRLSSNLNADQQDALLRMTILFERALWLARRLVVGLSQARRGLAAA